MAAHSIGAGSPVAFPVFPEFPASAGVSSPASKSGSSPGKRERDFPSPIPPGKTLRVAPGLPGIKEYDPMSALRRGESPSSEDSLPLPGRVHHPCSSREVPVRGLFFSPPDFAKEPPSIERKMPRTPARFGAGEVRSDNLFRESLRKAGAGSLIIGGTEHRLIRLGAGEYKTAYEFRDGKREILPGITGDMLVAKTYEEEAASRKPDIVLQRWTTHSMRQYRKVAAFNAAEETAASEGTAVASSADAAKKGSKLPIAAIYNEPLADGYFLCEKVSKTWEESSLWADPRVEVTDLPEDVQVRLESFRNFFLWALRNREPLDLKEDNFGVRPNGELVLLDFLEDEEDGVFAMLNTRMLTFSLGNRHVFEYLINPLKDVQKEKYELMLRCFEDKFDAFVVKDPRLGDSSPSSSSSSSSTVGMSS